MKSIEQRLAKLENQMQQRLARQNLHTQLILDLQTRLCLTTNAFLLLHDARLLPVVAPLLQQSYLASLRLVDELSPPLAEQADPVLQEILANYKVELQTAQAELNRRLVKHSA